MDRHAWSDPRWSDSGSSVPQQAVLQSQSPSSIDESGQRPRQRAEDVLMDETLWEAVFAGLAKQMREDSHGGGTIGKASAVLEALGLDPDMTIRDFRRLVQS